MMTRPSKTKSAPKPAPKPPTKGQTGAPVPLFKDYASI